MKKTKLLSMVLSVFLIGTFLCSCNIMSKSSSSHSNSTGSSGDGITLKVMTHRTDIVDTDLKTYAEEYKKKTGVTIQFVGVDDYDANMQVKIRANDDYGDVLMIPGISKEEYSKYLEPLGKASDADIKDYQINKSTAVEENGDYTVYGLSYGLGAHGVVYNKAAFEKAGVNPEEMKTFEQFYEGCQKLKDAGIIPVATNFKDEWTLSNWYATAKCFSGDPDFDNKLYKEDSIFDTSKPIGQMIEFTSTLINRGYTESDLLNTDWDKAKQDLADGKVAMMVLCTWIIPQEQGLTDHPENIGFMPVPTIDGNTYTILSTDYAVGISSKCEHKKEARDFVFAFNESDFAKNNGFIPNNKNLTDMDTVISDFLNSGVNEIIENPVSDEDKGKTEEAFTNANIDKNKFVQKPFLYSLKSMEKMQTGIDDLNEEWNNRKK